MCYNCGCKITGDDHGKGHMGIDPTGKAITNKTFEEAAKAFDLSPDETRHNTHDLLMAQIKTADIQGRNEEVN